jgi:hypothetical protein
LRRTVQDLLGSHNRHGHRRYSRSHLPDVSEGCGTLATTFSGALGPAEAFTIEGLTEGVVSAGIKRAQG